MFIRQTRTRNKITGEGYFTFRLVRGERIGGKVRQITVLNLGRHFPINLKTAIESADYADFRRFSLGYCFLRITPGG
jgi:hypothetical protein